MSWSARIAHTSTGLAIVFAGPVTRLDFTPDVAAHFARLLAAEAGSRPANSSTVSDFSPQRSAGIGVLAPGGVPTTLEAKNGSNGVVRRRIQHQNSHTSVQQMYRENPAVFVRATVARTSGGDRQNDATDTFLPEIMPIQVIDAHPLCCDCDHCLNGDHDA